MTQGVVFALLLVQLVVFSGVAATQSVHVSQVKEDFAALYQRNGITPLVCYSVSWYVDVSHQSQARHLTQWGIEIMRRKSKSNTSSLSIDSHFTDRLYVVAVTMCEGVTENGRDQLSYHQNASALMRTYASSYHDDGDLFLHVAAAPCYVVYVTAGLGASKKGLSAFVTPSRQDLAGGTCQPDQHVEMDYTRVKKDIDPPDAPLPHPLRYGPSCQCLVKEFPPVPNQARIEIWMWFALGSVLILVFFTFGWVIEKVIDFRVRRNYRVYEMQAVPTSEKLLDPETVAQVYRDTVRVCEEL